MSAPREQLFLEVHRDHGALIAKTARAFTDNAADRDDLSQEILLALWQALPQFRGQAKLSTYVYRVAHSCALNWKRSRQRYSHKIDSFGLEITEDAPAASATQRERIDWLYARIRELPPVDRSLLLLHLDQLAYAEIADVTGLTEANVGVRLHRLKQHLISLSEPSKNEL